MLNYNTSELSENPYVKLVHLRQNQTIEARICTRAMELLCSNAYLQSTDCLKWSSEVIALSYLLLAVNYFYKILIHLINITFFNRMRNEMHEN